MKNVTTIKDDLIGVQVNQWFSGKVPKAFV
jgi:hypothetical protein